MSGAAWATAQVFIALGLTKFIIKASGQSSRMSRQMSSSTGIVRSARKIPPIPRVSAMVWRRPNCLGISKSATVLCRRRSSS
jgi:hypothetical protein